MTGELLIDLNETARRLSICRRSVQAKIYSGELSAVRIGRSRRIAVADLDAYVNRLREENDRGTGSLAVVNGGGQDRGLAAHRG